MKDQNLLAALRANFGETIMTALQDPEVVEIMVNPDGHIWVEKLGLGMELAGSLNAGLARSIVCFVASGLGTVATVEEPIVEGELPLDGSRFEGLLPPVVSAPSFAIRKKASKVFTLEQYIAEGIMPEKLLRLFHEALRERQNILVVGGTGSGKTTLVNAFIEALSRFCPDDRLVILEDTLELQSKSRNAVFFRTSRFVSMQDLLAATMRYRPDRILVGEVRGKAALDLLKAWNTGHPGGLATVHANSAEEGLDRLEELVEEAGNGPKQKLIGRAVDLVVFIQRAPGLPGRLISQVIRVHGYQPKEHTYKTEVIYHVDSRHSHPGNGKTQTAPEPLAGPLGRPPGPLS